MHHNQIGFYERGEVTSPTLGTLVALADGLGVSLADLAGAYETEARRAADDMEEAHIRGMHDELPRDGCPECVRARRAVEDDGVH